MAGQRGTTGNGRGFPIADFSDHDHIGIVTQETAQLSETIADGFGDLHLLDAFHAVFDRSSTVRIWRSPAACSSVSSA